MISSELSELSSASVDSTSTTLGRANVIAPYTPPKIRVVPLLGVACEEDRHEVRRDGPAGEAELVETVILASRLVGS